MITSKMIGIFVVLALVCHVSADVNHVLHGLYYNISDEKHVYYGSLNLDNLQFNLINSLSIDEIGDPRNRKYSVLPVTYDPNNDFVYVVATGSGNQPLLSIINATSGVLLRTFTSISTTIVSLQYDIFQKQLFGHIETNTENVSQIVEIDTDTGSVKRVLATINNAQPTDISSYCPVCRKYFFIVVQDQHCAYVGVDSTDAGGISWQTPINFAPMNIRFDYKTFIMYSAFVNQTDRLISSVGVLNRTLESITDVVGIISDDQSIIVTNTPAYDVAEKIYYSTTIYTSPYSLGVSYVDISTANVKSISLSSVTYHPYAWFVKQFVH